MEKLYKIIDVISNEATYPYCPNCFKRVHFLGYKKSWKCSSCDETFNRVNHRYKLTVGVVDTTNDHFARIALFGKRLDFLFGLDSNEFFRLAKSSSSATNEMAWSERLSDALKQCLVGRWFLFKLKATSEVALDMRVVDADTNDYLTVCDYLLRGADIDANLNFSISSDHEDNNNNNNDDGLVDSLCQLTRRVKLSDLLDD